MCNPALAGSYYVVVAKTLDWIDAGSFLSLEALFLFPISIGILVFHLKELDRDTVVSGLLLGSVLFLNMFISVWSISFTMVTNAGFYPALIGPMTVFAAWLVFGIELLSRHLLAALIAFAGAVVLISSGFNASGNWRGDILAFVATAVFVLYILLLERRAGERANSLILWAAQMLTVSALAIVVYIGIGTAPLQVFHSRDFVFVGAYSAIFTTMLPVLFSTYAQKHLSAVFVSFTYLLEPLWAAGLAFLIIGERLGYLQFLGGVLILTASLIMWAGDRREKAAVQATVRTGA
ncbi:EamA-like transporter family protein [Phyllobacterium myrsinacearum]|nr:EamA-like transporter family protein [Phyllobacterium myrsinacearum]RZV08977.1 EamA-like transporter family protein [Phyllobacterium myrsinacearum]